MLDTKPDAPVLDMTPSQAAEFGLPLDIEPWRLELVLAIRDPDEYAAVLAEVDNAALFASMARMQWIAEGARLCMSYFVPEALAADFLDILQDLRARIAIEGAARGVTLMTRPFQSQTRTN